MGSGSCASRRERVGARSARAFGNAWARRERTYSTKITAWIASPAHAISRTASSAAFAPVSALECMDRACHQRRTTASEDLRRTQGLAVYAGLPARRSPGYIMSSRAAVARATRAPDRDVHLGHLVRDDRVRGRRLLRRRCGAGRARRALKLARRVSSVLPCMRMLADVRGAADQRADPRRFRRIRVVDRRVRTVPEESAGARCVSPSA